ncbi:MAG: hypothetical protein H0V10_02635, partial [Geodermatophilaceae bacterium]|nr:hypothetical protein [Geodermatophilaceae bacterium]
MRARQGEGRRLSRRPASCAARCGQLRQRTVPAGAGETAAPGFVARIEERHLPRLLRDFDPEAVRRRMSGVTAPLNVGSVAWDTIEAHVVQAGLRNQIELLTDLLVEHGTGVLITLDEIHQNQVEELREVATTVQHAFREGREPAFARRWPGRERERRCQRRRPHVPAAGRAPRLKAQFGAPTSNGPS